MTSSSAPGDVGALWLQTLQRAVGRASHDVKDALNGISVNLEVIRSRAARPDTPASAVAQFGEAAAQQFDRLASLVDAVLTLGRAERDPADVTVTLRRVATLCSASASSADALVHVVQEGLARSTMTSVRGDVLRLVLTATLLDLVVGADRYARASDVLCTVTGRDDDVVVLIAAVGRPATLPAAAVAAARAAGVRWEQHDDTLTIAFPRA